MKKSRGVAAEAPGDLNEGTGARDIEATSLNIMVSGAAQSLVNIAHTSKIQTGHYPFKSDQWAWNPASTAAPPAGSSSARAAAPCSGSCENRSMLPHMLERRPNMHPTNLAEPQKPQRFYSGAVFMWTLIVVLIVLVLAVIFEMR
jgi:hypothetical protein